MNQMSVRIVRPLHWFHYCERKYQMLTVSIPTILFIFLSSTFLPWNQCLQLPRCSPCPLSPSHISATTLGLCLPPTSLSLPSASFPHPHCYPQPPSPSPIPSLTHPRLFPPLPSPTLTVILHLRLPPPPSLPNHGHHGHGAGVAHPLTIIFPLPFLLIWCAILLFDHLPSPASVSRFSPGWDVAIGYLSCYKYLFQHCNDVL